MHTRTTKMVSLQNRATGLMRVRQKQQRQKQQQPPAQKVVRQKKEKPGRVVSRHISTSEGVLYETTISESGRRITVKYRFGDCIYCSRNLSAWPEWADAGNPRICPPCFTEQQKKKKKAVPLSPIISKKAASRKTTKWYRLKPQYLKKK